MGHRVSRLNVLGVSVSMYPENRVSPDRKGKGQLKFYLTEKPFCPCFLRWSKNFLEKLSLQVLSRIFIIVKYRIPAESL